MNPLAILRRVDLPAGALRHRNVTEARVCAKVLAKGKNVEHGGVIGTRNHRGAELYGWDNPVAPHVDNTGEGQWIYGLLLVGVCSVAIEGHSVALLPGHIFRLNDTRRHWTVGRGPSVCIFTGEYDDPEDDHATTVLERGLRRLAAGVRTAPRIGPGFRVLWPDEVLATNDFHKAHCVTRKLAERRDWFIETCADCDQPAARLDDKWPYFSDMNRCHRHLKGDKHD